MHRRLALAASLLTLAACAPGEPKGGVPKLGAIDEAGLRAGIETLSSDAFDGRAPATPGGEMTTAYLVDQMKAIGLKPGNGDSYEQRVGLVEQTVDPAASNLTFDLADGTTRTLAYGTDAVYWSKQVAENISFADSDVVFVGFGVDAPEYSWNDFAGVDVRGKTVIMLINDPGFYLNDARFNGRAMTYYGRWTYKFEQAARAGAAAALIVHETEPAAYDWTVVQGSWSGAQLDLQRADDGASRVMLEGWITLDAARTLFTAAGQNYDEAKAAALSGNFTAVPLTGLTAGATIRNEVKRSESANIAGVLPGRTRPDEYVVYMAHWDHLGNSQAAGAAAEPGKDTIFNGAVDNATGTSGILEIARSFATARTAPDRSIMFVAVTAEESGLLGSAYFAENPLAPLSNIVGGINIDAVMPTGPARDLIVVGFGASELEDVLKGVADRYGKVLRADPTPEKGFFYRSDHISLAKKGVPMLYVDKGIDLVTGGEEAGRAAEDAYSADRYHQPADEYAADWDLSGMTETFTILRDVGAELAYSDAWPNWYPGNEFRALRDAMRPAAN